MRPFSLSSTKRKGELAALDFCHLGICEAICETERYCRITEAVADEVLCAQSETFPALVYHYTALVLAVGSLRLLSATCQGLVRRYTGMTLHCHCLDLLVPLDQNRLSAYQHLPGPKPLS